VTNQITTHVSHDLGRQSDWSDELDEDLQGDGSVVTAALGNAWSHCVNTRLLLQYMQGGKRMVRAGDTPRNPTLLPHSCLQHLALFAVTANKLMFQDNATQ